MNRECWKVLSIDDDEPFRLSLQFSMQNLKVDNIPVLLFTADSPESAQRVLRSEPDIAVILLDVVMNTDSAGLDLIPVIKSYYKNESQPKIIVLTGQAGMLPTSEEELLSKYPIDGYCRKLDLSKDKLSGILHDNIEHYRANMSCAI